MAEGILVFCEVSNGSFRRSSFELLSKAHSLLPATGGVVSAVVIGDVDVTILGKYGAKSVYQVKGEEYNVLNTGPSVRALQAAVSEASPKVLLGETNAVGRDLLPRLAARLNAGLAVDVIDLSLVDDQIVARRPHFTGRVLSDIRITSEVQLFSVRAGSFSASEEFSCTSELVPLDVTLEEHDSAATLQKIIESEVAVVDLTEADRIVAGGRSVKSKEAFDTLIRPLSAAIGATPGASRAAVDAGYAPHSDQVGQTGKVVNPTLYIACGISGAIQHLAGMRTSRIIVSINKDKDAPIFKHSTYGIVADMFDVVPVLTKALAGGEIPAAPVQKKSESSEKSVETAKTVSKEEPAKPEPAAKKSTAPAPAAPKQSKPEPVASVSSAPVPVATSAVPQVTAAFDPRLLDEVKGEIASLKEEISKLKDVLSKQAKDSNAALKKDIQRVEQNARNFQTAATTRVESIEKSVTSEVRRIREKTREGIANDTAHVRTDINSLGRLTTATMVLTIICLCAILVLMILSA